MGSGPIAASRVGPVGYRPSRILLYATCYMLRSHRTGIHASPGAPKVREVLLWKEISYDLTAMDISARIRQTLAQMRPRVIPSGYAKEAAVLMPIFERGGEPHFLLTLRTQDVETHKGQISFPGGMRHGHEDLEQTALRETHEEIGLEGRSIELLGRFHDYISSTDYRVTPFVGHITESFDLALQPSEVAAVIEVPFRVFLDPARLRVEKMMLRSKLADVYFYDYDRHQIWGLTARIIHDFLAELAPAGRI